MKDYEFFDGNRRVKLSELFEDCKPFPFMYHVMYFQDDKAFCPMCSMWIDGLDGIPASTVLVFEKTRDGVRHIYTAHAEIVKDASYRGVDQLCPAWHVFDLLPIRPRRLYSLK